MVFGIPRAETLLNVVVAYGILSGTLFSSILSLKLSGTFTLVWVFVRPLSRFIFAK